MNPMAKSVIVSVTFLLLTFVNRTPSYGGVEIVIKSTDYVNPSQMPRYPGMPNVPGQNIPNIPAQPQATAMQKKIQTIKILAEGLNLKVITQSEDGTVQSQVIFRGKERQMIVPDSESMTHVIVDSNSIKAMSQQIKALSQQFNSSAMAQQMQEALKNVPEDKRARVEQMMKKNMPQPTAPPKAAVEVKKLKDSQEMDDYTCYKVEATQNGKKIGEYWVTDWDRIEGGKQVLPAFEAMSELTKEMREAFAGSAGKPNKMSSQFGKDVFEHLKALGGFPVETKRFDPDSGQLTHESILRSATERKIDSSVFKPDAKSKPRSMMGSMMGGPGMTPNSFRTP